MKNAIKCPKCGEEIEIDKVLSHQIEEQVIASLESKHKVDLANVKKLTEEEVGKKALEKFESQLSNLQKEKDEEKERNAKLTQQLDELLEAVRKLRRKDEEREVEMKKKILNEEEKIRDETRKNVLEEHELKDKEKDKKLSDALKKVEELKTKMEQGSQQTQGEVLELEIEEILKREFPTDLIVEVKKGQRGGDTLQRVIDKKGKDCGTILWESKNAQWSNQWIGKLKEDQRQAKAHLAVIVLAEPPEGLETFMFKEGVWLVVRKMIIPLALALRFDLIRVNYEKLSSVGKNEKMEVLYQYMTSVEFTHRIEAIIEAFGGMQDEMEREKRWFQTKWARQEKQLRKVIDHTQGMYGDLQGVIGKSLPDIKALQLDSGEEEID